MANAKIIHAYPTVILELTTEEAQVLKAVCNKIGGDPYGPRKYVENISSALVAIGVSPAPMRSGENDPLRGGRRYDALYIFSE